MFLNEIEIMQYTQAQKFKALNLKKPVHLTIQDFMGMGLSIYYIYDKISVVLIILLHDRNFKFI